MFNGRPFFLDKKGLPLNKKPFPLSKKGLSLNGRPFRLDKKGLPFNEKPLPLNKKGLSLNGKASLEALNVQRPASPPAVLYRASRNSSISRAVSSG